MPVFHPSSSVKRPSSCLVAGAFRENLRSSTGELRGSRREISQLIGLLIGLKGTHKSMASENVMFSIYSNGATLRLAPQHAEFFSFKKLFLASLLFNEFQLLIPVICYCSSDQRLPR